MISGANPERAGFPATVSGRWPGLRRFSACDLVDAFQSRTRDTSPRRRSRGRGDRAPLFRLCERLDTESRHRPERQRHRPAVAIPVPERDRRRIGRARADDPVSFPAVRPPSLGPASRPGRSFDRGRESSQTRVVPLQRGGRAELGERPPQDLEAIERLDPCKLGQAGRGRA
jgi:hypothetical protein